MKNRFKKFLYALLGVFCAFGTTPVWAAASHAQEKRDSMDYEHWDLYLHENQCYLGRTFVQLKDEEGVDDFLSIEGEVRDEFFLIGGRSEGCSQNFFSARKDELILQRFFRH